MPIVPRGSIVEVGTPSEAISQNGRRVDSIEVATDQTVTVTVVAQGLPHPITHMNSVRVVFPDGYDYVPLSANPGKLGGQTWEADGLWANFCSEILFPPDTFMVERPVGDGLEAIDFNVTTLTRTLDASPVGHGELFNFKLENTGSQPLTLEFVKVSDDGLKRSYYSDLDNNDYFFGNTISFKIK